MSEIFTHKRNSSELPTSVAIWEKDFWRDQKKREKDGSDCLFISGEGGEKKRKRKISLEGRKRMSTRRRRI